MRMYEEGGHRVPERDGMDRRPLSPAARLPTMQPASIALPGGRLPCFTIVMASLGMCNVVIGSAAPAISQAAAVSSIGVTAEPISSRGIKPRSTHESAWV